MNKHQCIKKSCPNTYEDEEVDNYYCPSCVEQNKIIAKQIDEKLKSSVSKKPIKSDFQLFEELQKQTGSKFINCKAFGL